MISPIVDALIISIAINLFTFIFAYKHQSDHYTDITYSLTFALLAAIYYTQGDMTAMPRVLLMCMIVIWAVRLGSYLKRRIAKIGVDHRFDKMRPNWKRYMRFWMIQGSSVWLISIPFILYLSNSNVGYDYEAVNYLGFAIWFVGFLLETIADAQKFAFRNNPKNEGQFMKYGLFSIIRFPNYLGEMMVWIGVFIYVLPALSGAQYASIISPLWICFLLLGLSGIPMLDRQSKKRYGHLDSFQKYKAETKNIIPYIY